MKTRTPAPALPWDDVASQAAYPKPRKTVHEPVDTKDLHLAKMHPLRDPGFLRWLKNKLCVGFEKTNQRTGVKHLCWHPDGKRSGHWVSDAMHTGKAMSGRLKQSDAGAYPGCRHFHREAEGNLDRSDKDYGIDRHAIAAELYAQFLKERGDR